MCAVERVIVVTGPGTELVLAVMEVTPLIRHGQILLELRLHVRRLGDKSVKYQGIQDSVDKIGLGVH